MLVAQGLGEPLRLAQIREDAAMLEPLPEGITQAKADINRLLVALAPSGRCSRATSACSKHATASRLAERQCLVARLAAVGDGLVPHLAPQGMVRQPFHLVGEPVGIVLFDGCDNAAMEQALPLAQQPP